MKLATDATKCTTALWSKYRSGVIPVIPDIKCKSPGEGDLLKGRNPLEIAMNLAEAGAPVISVVTESDHYGGSPELLYKIAKATSLPILRKDFIATRDGLMQSVDMGASGVLLIASMLTKGLLSHLIDSAMALGIEPLVETHNQAEILSIKDLPITFLGINNRNISQWEVDDGNVSTTERLAGLVRSDVLLLSESSISTPADVRRAASANAHAVLIGTAILKAQDPAEQYKLLNIPRS